MPPRPTIRVPYGAGAVYGPWSSGHRRLSPGTVRRRAGRPIREGACMLSPSASNWRPIVLSAHAARRASREAWDCVAYGARPFCTSSAHPLDFQNPAEVLPDAPINSAGRSCTQSSVPSRVSTHAFLQDLAPPLPPNAALWPNAQAHASEATVNRARWHITPSSHACAFASRRTDNPKQSTHMYALRTRFTDERHSHAMSVSTIGPFSRA
jgi:hypothetical protein